MIRREGSTQMRRKALGFFSTVLSLLLCSSVGAQAVQAVRSLNLNQTERRQVIERLSVNVTARLAAYQGLVGRMRAMSVEDRSRTGADTVTDLVAEAVSGGRATLEEADDLGRFLVRYKTFTTLDSAARASIARTTFSLSGQVATLSAPPALANIPEVAFVIGGAMVVAKDRPGIGVVEVSTNLLGAAAGSAFDAIGSNALKEYFQDNLTIGTGFPIGGTHRLTATLGVGLGTLRIGNFGVWPAISVQQFDSSDARVPRALVAANPGQQNWSSPMISLAVAPWGLVRLQERISRGRLQPIFTVGVRIPYYYPDDPFAAVAALFTGQRVAYQKSSSPAFEVGVFFPLLKGARLPPLSNGAQPQE